MTRLLRQHWPLLLALFALGLTLLALWILSIRRTQGHFIYALDDPYIHMAMAKNFVGSGVWGVTRYEFSSSSSSVLWTLLLSLAYLISGVHEKTPLTLNIFFSMLSAGAAYLFLKTHSITQTRRFLLLLAFIFLAPLPSLVFSGMEHTAQILLDLAFVFLSARVLSNESFSFRSGDSLMLLALATFVPFIRYEGLFLVSVVGLLFILRRRTLYALALGIAATIPVGIYGLVSVRHGSFWLPNSVLLKGTLPVQSPASILARAATRVLEAHHLSWLLMLALCLFFFRRGRIVAKWERGQLLLIIFTASSILHLLFAAVGWFYRYEAYLVAIGILACGSLLCETLPGWSTLKNRSRLTVSVGSITLALLFLVTTYSLVKRGVGALRDTPQGSEDIFRQQYQMSIFLRDYYQGAAVAANDIGAINYYADIRCLDLWGLGSAEVTGAKLAQQFDTRKIEELTGKHGVKIAVVYAGWFGGNGSLPARWRKVGQWRTPGCIVCGNDTVSFYSVDPSEIETLINDLRDFYPRLPPNVKQNGRYVPAR